MHRRLGFVLSLCGMMFAVIPLSMILPKPDFILCLSGFVFSLLGIFFTIEEVARRQPR